MAQKTTIFSTLARPIKGAIDLGKVVGSGLTATRDAREYVRDSAQRAVLYADIMRQRGNQFFEHNDAGQPPVLTFGYELIVDGRDLARPVNYYLLRILPEEGQAIDPTLRPYVVIDPRAGHGPGIGGSKRESQVGVALDRGHAVYFVGFRPMPEPEQTLADIADAEAYFLREVRRRHPDAPCPSVFGNCQAGWAVAMLAAVEPDVCGPIILSGAPMSYWAGVDGKNPMRYLGGLYGGTWMTSMMADMGDGRFDGAYLVMNFENLNPANTLWKKQYNVWRRVDTEGPRFLKFERWWNGFFLMNDSEMEFIVDNLFIGNRLGGGKVKLCEDRTVSLVDIKAPIVIFASGGDNITPPQQALNWIADVYPSDEAILADEQVIVYTLHEEVGHLGIFVSSKIARRQHKSIIGVMDHIERLPPGLYEMIIDDKDASNDAFDFDYAVRFEERHIQDILSMDDTREEEEAFAALAKVSEFNANLYRTWARPWVQMVSNPVSARLMREMLPIRLQHRVFSDKNPAMFPVRWSAARIRARRKPAGDDNAFVKIEREASDKLVGALDSWRDVRDAAARRMFMAIYGKSGLGAYFGDEPASYDDDLAPMIEAMRERVQGGVDQGGWLEGFARVLVMLSRADEDVEPRAFIKLDELVEGHERFAGVDAQTVRGVNTEQYIIMRLMRDEAIAHIPALLGGREDRELAVALAKEIVLFEAPNLAEERVLAELDALLFA